MSTRRNLLGSMLTLSAGFLFTREIEGLGADPPNLTIRLGSKPAVSVPANFTGLGYEMSSVAPIGLLSATNVRGNFRDVGRLSHPFLCNRGREPTQVYPIIESLSVFWLG